MKLTDETQTSENWFEALALWNRVANWSHYGTSQSELTRQIKSLLLFLWNEKDWLKTEHPSQKKYIEAFVNDSTHIKVVADLANTIKHRKLTNPPRSEAQQTNYFGRIEFGSGKSREMYYVETGNNQVKEVFSIIKGALEEYDELHRTLRKP